MGPPVSVTKAEPGPAVLVLRPEPGLGETLAAVAAMGFEPMPCPMLRIVSRPSILPDADALDAILLTSGQAVAAVSNAPLTGLRLFAVGDSTAARARAAGFSRCESASGDAADLTALVRARLAAGSVLLLATGAGQGDALAQRLRRAGYRVHRRAVYAARPVRYLPAAARAALDERRVGACLFFSAETARNFARLLPVSLRSSLDGVRALAIGPAAGAALESLPFRVVRVASHPDAASLLALLRSPS